jgi:hypothetical protein
LLPEEQHGFRSNHSTIQQLKRVIQHAKEGLKNKMSTGLVALDVEKAFDRVWHNGLVYKMINMKFPTYLILITKSFLTNRKFRVKIGSSFSIIMDIIFGVPQGAVLSPTLYNIFTCDIPRGFICKLDLFADDTALYSSSETLQPIIDSITKAADEINDFMIKWKINLNQAKTDALFITNRRSNEIPTENLDIFDSSIAWSKELKYLGMIIDKKITFKPHIDYVTQRTNTAIRVLYPLINRKSRLDMNNKLLIYKLAIRPIFTYAAPAFKGIAATHIKKLQVLQNKCLKMILDKPRSESTQLIHEAANIPLVSEYIDKLTKKFDSKC